MQNSPFIAEVTRQSFADLVIKKSHQVPVLVDFWAAWCAPCQMLMPILAKLADEYQGKFLLAKVNTDLEQDLALEYAVRSLPTVKLFRNGRVADEFMGAQPESAVRMLIDRYVARRSDALVNQAYAAENAGDRGGAVHILREALETDPANDRTKLELTRVLLDLAAEQTAAAGQPHKEGEISALISEGERILGSLSVQHMSDPEVVALTARLELLKIATGAPPSAELERSVAADPDDSEARYRLGAQKILAGEYEPGMQQFLEIVRRDRKFNDDAARKALVGVFNLLGNRNQLVTRYRSLLSRALN